MFFYVIGSFFYDNCERITHSYVDIKFRYKIIYWSNFFSWFSPFIFLYLFYINWNGHDVNIICTIHTFNKLYLNNFKITVLRSISYLLHYVERGDSFCSITNATELFCRRKYSNFNGKFALYYGKLLQTSGIKMHQHRAYNSFPRCYFGRIDSVREIHIVQLYRYYTRDSQNRLVFTKPTQ